MGSKSKAEGEYTAVLAEMVADGHTGVPWGLLGVPPAAESGRGGAALPRSADAGVGR